METKGFNRLILFITFVMIIIISPSVYGAEINANVYVSASKNGTSRTYKATEIVNTGSSNTYTLGNTISGRASVIEFYINYPFEANYPITLTLQMNTQDWSNHFGGVQVTDAEHGYNTNLANGGVTWVSNYKVKVTFTPTENMTDAKVRLYSTNTGSTSITCCNNWNLKTIYLYDSYYAGSSGSGGSSGGGATGTTDATNQQIIDNNNQNTNDIIDNNNDNTENIIENNTENTNKIIDSNLVCKGYSISSSGTLFNGYLRNTGEYVDQPGNYNKTTDFIEFNPSSRFFLAKPSGTNKRLCFYNLFRESVGCFETNQYDEGYEFQVPSNSAYFRINFEVSDSTPIINVCQNGNQAINDTIKDDSVDNGVGSSFFNDFDSDDNGGISAIVTKPLMIINNLLTNNNQCSNLTLPEFMGVSTAYLPSGCILWDNATSTMINLWNIFVCGLGSYFILKDLFRIIENLKNPDNDKVEVMDL